MPYRGRTEVVRRSYRGRREVVQGRTEVVQYRTEVVQRTDRGRTRSYSGRTEVVRRPCRGRTEVVQGRTGATEGAGLQRGTAPGQPQQSAVYTPQSAVYWEFDRWGRRWGDGVGGLQRGTAPGRPQQIGVYTPQSAVYWELDRWGRSHKSNKSHELRPLGTAAQKNRVDKATRKCAGLGPAPAPRLARCTAAWLGRGVGPAPAWPRGPEGPKGRRGVHDLICVSRALWSKTAPL